MGGVSVDRLCYGPSLQWAEFAMGRDVQLPFVSFKCAHKINLNEISTSQS